MKVIAILTHPHQEEAIEKILRSRGQERRVRGPPSSQHVPAATEMFAPTARDDDLNQVPPGDPWEL